MYFYLFVEKIFTEAQQMNNKRMFYYADLMTELAIHVPTLNLKKVKFNFRGLFHLC